MAWAQEQSNLISPDMEGPGNQLIESWPPSAQESASLRMLILWSQGSKQKSPRRQSWHRSWMLCSTYLMKQSRPSRFVSYLPSIGWYLSKPQVPEGGGQPEDFVLWLEERKIITPDSWKFLLWQIPEGHGTGSQLRAVYSADYMNG